MKNELERKEGSLRLRDKQLGNSEFYELRDLRRMNKSMPDTRSRFEQGLITHEKARKRLLNYATYLVERRGSKGQLRTRTWRANHTNCAFG